MEEDQERYQGSTRRDGALSNPFSRSNGGAYTRVEIQAAPQGAAPFFARPSLYGRLTGFFSGVACSLKPFLHMIKTFPVAHSEKVTRYLSTAFFRLPEEELARLLRNAYQNAVALSREDWAGFRCVLALKWRDEHSILVRAFDQALSRVSEGYQLMGERFFVSPHAIHLVSILLGREQALFTFRALNQ